MQIAQGFKKLEDSLIFLKATCDSYESSQYKRHIDNEISMIERNNNDKLQIDLKR